MFFEISQNSEENICARDSFLIKSQAPAYDFIKKENLAQMSSCEFCEISKNTLFIEHLRTTASGYSWHFEIFKTIQRIYNNYWGPTVKVDVTNFVSAYKMCLSIKIPNRPCGKMGRRKWPTVPLELISLDFLVDLPRTTKCSPISN